MKNEKTGSPEHPTGSGEGARLSGARLSECRIIKVALRAAIGTHGDLCKSGANCQAMTEFSAGFAAVERLEGQIEAKDDLLAEARLALRRLYNATPDHRSEVAAFEYAGGVLATLDADAVQSPASLQEQRDGAQGGQPK